MRSLLNAADYVEKPGLLCHTISIHMKSTVIVFLNDENYDENWANIKAAYPQESNHKLITVVEYEPTGKYNQSRFCTIKLNRDDSQVRIRPYHTKHTKFISYESSLIFYF